MANSVLSRARRGVLLTLFAPLLLPSCSLYENIKDELSGSSGSSNHFKLRASRQSTFFNTLLEAEGRLLAYQASEATEGPNGTDFNGDGDLVDLIASVIDVGNGSQYTLNVSVRDMQIVQSEVYLITDEELDSEDWNDDGVQDDLVLLHWSKSSGQVVFVDVLDREVDFQVAATSARLYYTVPPPVQLNPQTSLRYVDVSDPASPVTVLNGDFSNSLAPQLIGQDEDLLFLAQDETAEGRDLNGDLDQTDEFVVALVDATAADSPIRNTALAVKKTDIPIRAMATGPGDWLVGFPVQESSQGGANLNDPANFVPEWQPSQCAGLGDTDAADEVLHFINFAAFASDPLQSPPVNTGLVSLGRVVAVPGAPGSPGFLGTLSFEGNEGGCSLNGDSDQNDIVMRFCEATTPVRPFVDVLGIPALNGFVPGESLGLVELSGRLLCIIDEAQDDRDYDGTGQDYNLLAWIDPTLGNSATLKVDHSTGAGAFFAGISWMRASTDGSVLLAGLQEKVLNQPLNSGDSDTGDSVPAVISFDPDEPDTLQFPAPPVACDEDDAGISLAEDHILFRADELDDKRDLNNDGDNFDIVIMRSKLGNPQDFTFVSTLSDFTSSANNQSGTTSGSELAVTTDGTVGGGYVVLESVESMDLNKDGDEEDFVVRFFQF